MDSDDAQTKASLLKLLAKQPENTAALVELGNLALRTGYRSAACTAYRRAIEICPSDPALQVNLGNALLQGGELDAARDAYQAALRIDRAFPPAHQGLSFVFSRLGDEELAQCHRDLGFSGNAVQHVPHRGNAAARRVLVLVSAAGGDFNTGALLDARTFEVTKVFAEYATALPEIAAPYAIVNAIADADRCSAALQAADHLLKEIGVHRIVNPPELVLRTGRLDVMERLRDIPGLAVPRMSLIKRADLHRTGFEYPFLIRTPGHHTGRHFVYVEHAGDLELKAASLPGEELLAIEYIDVRSTDGSFRKYRVLAIGGRLFPAHLAVSANWKVHFFTSQAGESERHRAEDAQFLTQPREVVGERMWSTLQRIVDALQLDYAGVDFGIDAAGRLVIFEANATMSVYPVPEDPRWAYRSDATDRIIAAFGELVERRRT